ncbi:MAG: hypothetical protein MI784_02620 [Cytophagales bacterium]|nr:hypothetical protein [Cytophagales bacterium]
MERHQLADGGMPYFETNLEHYVAEPWNGLTAAIFVLLAAYWFFKIKKSFRRFPFISYALPLLLVGGIGGTLYHAFRSFPAYLYMDWVPILVLVLSASAYFFKHYFSSWIKSAGVITGAFLLMFLMASFTPEQYRFYAININYLLDALLILIPTLLIIRKVSRKTSYNVYWACASFGLALFFRSVDHLGWLPIGTHFLWHIFGAAACHLMLRFIYELEHRTVPAQAQP